MSRVGELASLRSRWRGLWRGLRARRVPERAFDELIASYGEPHRAYHGLDHLIDCLRILDDVAGEAQRPSELEAAVWFHDVVYDTRRDDDEIRSAELADRVLCEAGVDDAARRRVEELVLATRHQTPADDPDALLLQDIDLSVLGREPSGFLAYEEQIRSEYAWVPDRVFHARRAELLEGFQRRRPLYATPVLRARFERQARRNLARAVRCHRGALRSGTPGTESVD